jgi:hypothetical protein
MTISDHDRLAAIERDLARIARRLGEPRRRDKRDGREVLSVRVGDEVAALVRRSARQSGRTISDWVRQVILAAVNQPSTDHLTELRELPSPFMARTLPHDAVRQAITDSLARQARLTDAGAAVMIDRRPRDARSDDGAVFLPGSPWARR